MAPLLGIDTEPAVHLSREWNNHIFLDRQWKIHLIEYDKPTLSVGEYFTYQSVA